MLDAQCEYRNRGRRANAIIVDSQRLSRDALHRLLESPSLTVVAQGGTLTDTLLRLRPDVQLHLVIYNFASDFEAERELANVQAVRDRFSGVKSIVLTDCDQPAVLLRAVRIGVEAFLSRDISVDVLQRALELVLLGEYLLPTGLAQLLLDPLRRSPAADAAVREAPPAVPDSQRALALTPREREILQCLMDGRSNKVIARDLGIAEATVKAHVKALLRKTRMTNRTQAAIWAMNNKVLAAEAAIFIEAPPPLAVEHAPHAPLQMRRPEDIKMALDAGGGDWDRRCR